MPSKLLIGLRHVFDFLRTRGKGYQICEGDGLFYLYRVYDSYDLVAEWADRLLVLPCGPSPSRSWFHPLLTSEGVILSAILEPRENENASLAFGLVQHRLACRL